MTDKFARKVAVRLPAALINKTSYNFKRSEDQFEPNNWITPHGKELNRVLIMGVLTEKEDIGKDSENWRLRITEPSGTCFVYAGQYQPEAMTALYNIEAPCFVAVSGKLRSYTPEENGNTLISITPESISEVTELTYAHWLIETAQAWVTQTNIALQDTDLMVKKAAEVYGTPYNPEADMPCIKAMIEIATDIYGSPLPAAQPVAAPEVPAEIPTEAPIETPAEVPAEVPIDTPSEVIDQSTIPKKKEPAPKVPISTRSYIPDELQPFMAAVKETWLTPEKLTMKQLTTKLSKVNADFNAMTIPMHIVKAMELGLAFQPTSDTITFVTE